MKSMEKEIIVVVLIVMVIYLYWQNQQNNQPVIITEDNSETINNLQQEINHYQTLYQTRVEKDVGDSEKVVELTEQLTILEGIINKPVSHAETQTDLSKEDIINLTKKSEYYQTINKRLITTRKSLQASEEENQEQLRKINLLFDANANNYETIDFDGLYSLLQQIAERERERERERAKINPDIPDTFKEFFTSLVKKGK